MTEMVRASTTFPLPASLGSSAEGLIAFQRRRMREAFALELLSRLEARGGIVGPVHERESEREDFWLTEGKVVRYEMYAAFTDLPEPEQYRLMGGPADGHIVRTGGLPTWRVPVYAPPSMGNPFDLNETVEPVIAEYERQGDTAVYLYRRIAK